MKYMITMMAFVAMITAIVQVAPVLANDHAAKEAHKAALQEKAQQEMKEMENCKSGKTNTIMFKGVMCNAQ